MTLTEIMQNLEELGTAQNRKVYARHGAKEPMFGVSFGNLGVLKKQIKIDHALALELWATGNHDVRILATLIADSKKADSDLLDQWVQLLDNYVLTDAFSKFAASTAFAQEKMEAWTQSSDEWISSAGWTILCLLTLKDKKSPDDYFLPFLERIESGIHQQPNRTRYAMINALIAIGQRNDALEEKALNVVKTIGVVEVDHGETGCKTPDPVEYIRKAKARN